MKISVSLIFLGFVISLISCGNEGKSLGNNFSILQGDNEKDQSLVYCSEKSFGSCYAGIYVIPTYERHYQYGKYAEYLKDAKADENWIIARTLSMGSTSETYWIVSKNFNLDISDCDAINCDSILQSKVQGPLDLESFNQKRQELKLDLSFE